MTPKRKDVVLPSDARLEACGGDTRLLATMAAMGRLTEVDRIAGLTPSYNGRLAACDGDPRKLAAAMQNPEVAALLGLTL